MYAQRTCGKGWVATLCTRLTLIDPQKANCSERRQMFMITGGDDEGVRSGSAGGSATTLYQGRLKIDLHFSSSLSYIS